MTDDPSTNTEHDEKKQPADLLARARSQPNAATSEFQRGLSKIKDPGTRRQVTENYVHLLQNYLGKAQTTLARYRGKQERQDDAEQTAAPARPGESTAAAEAGEQATDPPPPSPHDGPREADPDT
jgi:hypothetical protein